MFVIAEDQLKSLIAPITPYYGSSSEWLSLEEGQLTTFSDLYRSQPGVRSVVDFIAGHLGRMPVKLYQQTEGAPGAEGERMHLRKHPVQKLLNVPNGHRRMGRSGFWRDAWMDLLIYDRMCLVKIKDLDSGDPVALVRIPPVWFTPYGQNYWWPEEIRIAGNRGFANFPIEDCVYMHGYDPVDPRIGTSPMTTLRAILEEEAAGTAWRRRFWESGAQPTMVVSRPIDAPEWDDSARDRFIESLRAAANRGKPLLLEEGMSTNPAGSFNPKSTEYLTTKKFTREEVLRVYNLPVGLFEQGSASNIGQYRAMLYSEAFAPLLSRWVDELETQLLTDFVDDPYEEGMFLEPAIDEKLRGDIMSQIETLVRASGGAAIMTRKEARDYLNLKTLPDNQHADVLIQHTTEGLADGTIGGGAPAATRDTGSPGQGSPLGGAPAASRATGKPPGRPPTGNVDPATAVSRDQSQNQTPTTTGGAKPTSKALHKRAEAPHDKRVKAQFTKEVTDVLQKFAARQRAAVMSARGAKATVPFDKKRWNKELKTDILREKTRVTNYYGTQTADRLDSGWREDRAAAYLDKGAEYAADNVNSHTEAALHGALSLDDVGAYFDKLSATRMPELAQDLVTGAKAFGAYEAAYQSAKIVKKVWNVMSDNPRKSHEAQDGEERDLSDEFTNGLRFPHDPSGSPDETAGCTCEMTMDVVSESDTADEGATS